MSLAKYLNIKHLYLKHFICLSHTRPYIAHNMKICPNNQNKNGFIHSIKSSLHFEVSIEYSGNLNNRHQIIYFSDAWFLLLTGRGNSGQIVCYSDHLKYWTKIVQYSDHHSNNKPFNYGTTFDHSNTRLVLYSDPQCSLNETWNTWGALVWSFTDRIINSDPSSLELLVSHGRSSSPRILEQPKLILL